MSKVIETINPFTEEKLKEYTLVSLDEAKNAVVNVDNCFAKWKLVTVAERTKLTN